MPTRRASGQATLREQATVVDHVPCPNPTPTAGGTTATQGVNFTTSTIGYALPTEFVY